MNEDAKTIAERAGFAAEGEAQDTALATTVGAQMASREQASIQARCVMALRNPRNETKAYTRIVTACKRPAFAEGARYVFPRGGNNIEGPSVKYAREAARCWGNIEYGIQVTDVNDERTTVEGWALDLETNTMVRAAATFKNLIQRKVGTGRNRTLTWIQPDERDYRELVNKHGAIAVRNSILQLIPPDVTDEAMRLTKETIVKAAKGEIEQDRDAMIRRLATAFRDLGVTPEMLAAKLEHELDVVTEEEIAELRGIYTSIREGQSKRDDYFDVTARKPTADSPQRGTTTAQAKDRLRKNQEPEKEYECNNCKDEADTDNPCTECGKGFETGTGDEPSEPEAEAGEGEGGDDDNLSDLF